MTDRTLVERLRDGDAVLRGAYGVESPILSDAASLIEEQAERIAKLEEALRGIIADGDNEDMDAETAWQSMYDRARAALTQKNPTPR